MPPFAFWDQSGVAVRLTAKLRPHNAGVLSIVSSNSTDPNITDPITCGRALRSNTATQQHSNRATQQQSNTATAHAGRVSQGLLLQSRRAAVRGLLPCSDALQPLPATPHPPG